MKLMPEGSSYLGDPVPQPDTSVGMGLPRLYTFSTSWRLPYPPHQTLTTTPNDKWSTLPVRPGNPMPQNKICGTGYGGKFGDLVSNSTGGSRRLEDFIKLGRRHTHTHSHTCHGRETDAGRDA